MGYAAEQAGAGKKRRAARGIGRSGKKEGRGKLAGPPATGRCRARQARKGEEEGQAGSGVGPVGEFFPNQIFFQFYFLHFHF